MDKENNNKEIIDRFLRTYSNARSESSFSYLVNYYLRNKLSNYKEIFINLILNSKNTGERFINAMTWFYSEAFRPEGSTAPFELLLYSNRLIDNMKNDEIIYVYNEVKRYFRNGENLVGQEIKLYDLFINSTLAESFASIVKPT